MRAAEEMLKQKLEENKCLWDEGYEHEFKAVNTPNNILEEVMKDYAKEAIIEDRKNVAEHAKIIQYRLSAFGMLHRKVDPDSIINAPQIELK